MTVNIWDLIVFTLVGSGAVGTLLYFFLKWGANLFADKFRENWRKESEIEIAQLKSTLDRNNQLLSRSFENLTVIGQRTIDERIQAIKKTWTTMLSIKELSSPYSFFLTILTPNEYLDEINEPRFSFSETGQEKITEFLRTDEVEKFRPFIGDHIWSYYFIYRAINLRTHHLIEKLKKGEEFGYWYEDSGMSQLMGYIFSEKEIDEIKKSGPHSFRSANEMIEIKILKEANYILSGKKSAIESFKSAEELRKLISKYDPN